MASRKTMALGIFAVFVVYGVWLFANAEKVADLMFSSSLGISLLLYLLVNPAYIIIILGVMFAHRDRLFKGFLAGVSLSLALDIYNLPRIPNVLPLNAAGVADFGLLSSNNVVLVNSDLIIAQAAVGFGIPYDLFRVVYYLVVPIGLLYFSIHLLGYSGFLKRLRGA